MMKPEPFEKLVEIYRRFARYPTVTSAQFLKSDGSSGIKIRSTWSQRNLEKKEITKFIKYYVINPSSGGIFTLPPVETSEQSKRFSPSETCFSIVQDVGKDSTGIKKKQFLEIWKDEFLYKNFDIEEFDVHGPIYTDDEFGSLEWSPDESKILYIAEKKAAKSLPFYTQKPKDPKQNDEQTGVGQEYAYNSDWGEQLVKKYQPVIGVCDINLESLKVLEGIPPNFSPGQVFWSKDGEGIFGIALNNEPRKLGLVYCTNRHGYVFYLSLKGEFSILSEENQSVRSPRMSPDGKYLYWLQRPAGGPHHACHELVKYDIKARKREVIVPIWKAPGSFSGIYSYDLPRRCFSNDGKLLFFSCASKTRVGCFSVNLETNHINVIRTEKSSVILDVYNDMLLLSSSSFQSSPCLLISQSIENIEFTQITKPEEIIKGSVVKHFEFEAPNDKDTFKYFNGVYFGPDPSVNKNVPLIVNPHGGPHSASYDSFSIESSFFVSLGFGVLFVNYRGSTGAGQDSVDFLPGRIGDSDVKDNHYAVTRLVEEFPYIDRNKIVLFGGSHGGFLVTHLSAQYPEVYKAVVTRNPVIDVLSMYTGTDIPDWDAVESGFSFNNTLPLTVEQAVKMLEVSPISRVEKIKAPTFVMLGKDDLRVPYNQGLSLYYLLKARNVITRLNLYEDNHVLGKVPVHMDSLINAALWFMKHLKITI